MLKFTTIIFDLSEVYLQWLKWTEFKLASILFISPEIINKKFFTKKLSLLFNWKISEDQYLVDLVQNNNWNISICELKNLIRNNFIEISWTKEIIEKLKHKWYKLWILSVHAKEWIEYCNNKYNYHWIFDYIVYSFDIWVSKPDKKSFLHILDLTQEDPKNILYIDDNIENVNTSINLWMKWILFTNSYQLENILKQKKIL